jgi:hypothetical protein
MFEDPEKFPEGKCEHVKEDRGQLVFQRYCHVYKRGELEDLCSRIPHCRILESGWDKGNWFVHLMKAKDARLMRSQEAEIAPLPITARAVL